MNVWLVSPAYGRFDLSAVTMMQWSILRSQIASRVSLDVVVVADDDNLDLADRHGFHTVERPNYELGRRYNDGFEYALEHGADFAVDAGTRNLIHPDLFDAVPWDVPVAHSGNLYGIVQDGSVQVFDCHNVFGRGPLFLPRRFLEAHPRPARETEPTLILHSICEHTDMPEIRFANVHDFQYVGVYRNDEPYTTAVSDYVLRWGNPRVRWLDDLARCYPRTVMDGVRRLVT